jgi:choline dehydrogenase-like flavoprotein
MLKYAQDFPPNSAHSADICIVGAGAAGITLAHKLLKSGKSVLLLESANLDDFGPNDRGQMRVLRKRGTYLPEARVAAGRRRHDSVAQRLNAGVESAAMRSIDPIFLTRSRLRAYGGTTNCWGGLTRPLSRADFHRVDLGPGQTWPISADALYPTYYDEAMYYCSLPPVGVDKYDQEVFWTESGRVSSGIEYMDLKKAGGKLVNAIYLIINDDKSNHHARLDFQTAWGPTLEKADPKVCLVLRNANVRSVIGGKSIDHLFGSTIEAGKHGRDFTARAERFVLATGGTEVARLLLASAATVGGFNSNNDNLGRYFQVHPLNSSYGTFAAGPNQPTQGILNLYQNNVTLRNVPYPPDLFAGLVPSDETLLQLNLRNFRASISFASSGARGVIEINWEQAPNPASRVKLSEKKDRFWGDPLAQLDWNTLPVDTEHTPEVGFDLVSEALEILGYGKNFRHSGPAITSPGDHHMGATRMGNNATEGYVDSNCRVFGADNLFIASSAVFTTSGYANPTLTIIALAARLADHLAGKQP